MASSTLDLDAVRAWIEQRVADEFARLPAVSVHYANEQFNPPSGESWIEVTINYGAGAVRETLDGANTLVGLTALNIYSPKGEGLKAHNALCNRARSCFNIVGPTDLGLEFEVASLPRQVSNDTWYQSLITCVFDLAEETEPD